MNLAALPDYIDTPAAWVGSSMSAEPSLWLMQLSDDQIAEIEHAADCFLNSGRNLGEMTARDFPLQSLAACFEHLQKVLLHGHGFQLIRGLPVHRYSEERAATVFCGLGAHLGKARSQNAQGHLLGHVRNTGASSTNPNTRIYQTAERQSFHTDSADVVGLLCLKDAREGGRSLLVSAVSIYNRMRQTSPDLLPLLFDPIATDRRGEIPPGEKPFMQIPVLSWHANQLTVFYQRQYIDSAQRFPDAMRLTDKHIEALNLFDELANEDNLHFGMQLQPGDMQFVYNHSLLHDRTAFTDWEDEQRRRHLLRLWLAMPNDRELPDSFRQRYGSIEIGNRGGIVTQNSPRHSP